MIQRNSTKALSFLVVPTVGLAAFSCINTEPLDELVSAEGTAALCDDGRDNDADGKADCEDDECLPFCEDDYVVPEEDPWHNRDKEDIDPGVYVSESPADDSFALVEGGDAVPLVVSDEDFDGVVRAAGDLQIDIARVTGEEPDLVDDVSGIDGSEAVLIGTLGRSPLIDALVEDDKFDASELSGKWETFVITTVENPTEELDRALVIVGSDQRGTIFGIYDLAAQMGVSPWHFWADVPAAQKDELHVLAGRHSQGEPAVKYRGIFINDENPALQMWHDNYFPDEGYAFKSGFYEKVFEVMLRLKANYLWPAVWGRAFAEDDPNNHATAKRYGIVMGTSHEAPMMRGIEEWNRDANEGTSDPYGGNGEWSYRTNPEALEAYWAAGIQRMVDEDFEGIVTIGMRGPGDVALPPEDGIPLVGDFVDAQRNIIADVTHRHPARVPQVWTLYKEVQEWWTEGLRVPTDVTVIWCDDNWGNLQLLPDPDEPERVGGYGIYYHFDYVGGPRSYKWVDTNLVPNIWEQLHLTYERGVDRVWMVNVGDLKSNELPTQFFLDYAWSPERWPAERLDEWEEQFAAQQFGADFAEDVAALLHEYQDLQSDRKPELLNRQGYDRDGSPLSLTNYREMERVVKRWEDLLTEAERVRDELPAAWSDAYYELVFYPVQASTLMYRLRQAGFLNLLYAEQGRVATGDMAALAEELFDESQQLRDEYHTDISDGKWDGFQTTLYLGYSDWNTPDGSEDFIYPELESIEIPEGVEMGVAIDGSDDFWTADDDANARLPTFSPYQTAPAQFIEVFARGSDAFDYEITVSPAADWLDISNPSGTIDAASSQVRAVLQVDDWSAVPEGETVVTVTVTNLADDSSVDVEAVFDNPAATIAEGAFVESHGTISIDATNDAARIIESDDVSWQLIPGIGRTGSGYTPMPVTAERQDPGSEDGARLEYDLHFFSTGSVTVWVYLSPRQNTYPTDGLKLALSMDGGDIETINVTEQLDAASFPLYKDGWQTGVVDNVHRVQASFEVGEPGGHVLQLWMVDPSVVVQNIVVDAGGLRPSYFGPPVSYVMPAE